MKTLRLSVMLFALSGAGLLVLHAADPAADPGYVPCKIYRTVQPVFPSRLLNSGVIRGEARVMLEIDTSGQVADTLVTAYTHRELADEALRVIKLWRYTPSLVERQPLVSTLALTFIFENAGTAVLERRGMSEPETLPAGETYAYRSHGLATLDHPPAALVNPRPIYPQAWIEAGRTGAVTITFFIDETGHARMPVADPSNDPYLAAAAVTTLKEWRFAPPTARGRPVLVQAQQDFVFEPETATAKDA